MLFKNMANIARKDLLKFLWVSWGIFLLEKEMHNSILQITLMLECYIAYHLHFYFPAIFSPRLCNWKLEGESY